MKKATAKTYQELAMSTCLPSAKNWGYAIYGLDSEYHELNAKISGAQAKEIRDGADFNKEKAIKGIADEVGDCYWFIALICELRGLRFEDIFRVSPLRFAFRFFKASFRDMGILRAIINAIMIRRWIVYLRKFCEVNKFDILDILQRNVEKLASRKERGVLKGSGDDR